MNEIEIQNLLKEFFDQFGEDDIYKQILIEELMKFIFELDYN